MSTPAIKQMNADRKKAGLPPRGNRSRFKDWSSECTNFRPEVAQAALAHKEADKVKGAGAPRSIRNAASY